MIEVVRRPHGFDDWKALLALLRESFAFMEGRIDPPSSLHDLSEEGLAEKSTAEEVLLAFDGQQLAGCLFAAVRPPVLYLSKIATRQSHQGRGIARRMMDLAAAIAREKGLSAMELQTRVELTENHRAFEAMGFAMVGESCHPGFDRPTSVIMRRELRRPDGNLVS